MKTNNSLTAKKAAIKESKIPFSGVVYVETDCHCIFYRTTTEKTSLSIYGYYMGGLVYDKYGI